MKTLAMIAWRNVWRNPKRSFVMIIAITMGLWGGIFASSLSFGLLDQRFQMSIGQHISHIQLHNPEFLIDQNVRHSVDQWQELTSMIENDDQVRAYSRRLVTNGMLASANLTRGVNIIGIEPALESRATGLQELVIEGSYFGEQMRNPILIGQALAEKTKLQERSRLVLTFQNAEGELTAATFRVAGIFRSANMQFDEMNVYVLHSDFTDYVADSPIYNEFALVTNHLDIVDPVAERYSHEFGNLEVRTWAEIAPELNFLQQMASTMLVIIIAIILLALAFGLVNTMLMSVFERIKELGVLMAVGMNKKRIFSMIILETSFLTFIGALCGIVLGGITVLIFGNVGINLAAVGGESMEKIGFQSFVYPQLDVSFFLSIAALVVITAMVTSIFPSIKALKLNPAEAVRKE
jgi:putative ABC transport system permease protein